MRTETAYIQHGTGTQGPFLTEKVTVKWSFEGKYKVLYEGKWRRLYMPKKSPNYLLFNGERLPVNFAGY